MMRAAIIIVIILISGAVWIFWQNSNGSATSEATSELSRTTRQVTPASDTAPPRDSDLLDSNHEQKSAATHSSNLILRRSDVADPEIQSWIEQEIGPNSTDAHLVGKYNVVKLDEVILAQIIVGDAETFSIDSGSLSTAPATITRLQKISDSHYTLRGKTNVRGTSLEFWFSVDSLWRIRGQIPLAGDGGVLAVRPIPNSDLHLIVEITGPIVHDH